MKKKIKAVGLFSGGLDSMIAYKIIEEQGISAMAINFVTAFFGNDKKIKETALKNKINLKVINVSKKYFKMLKNPKYGYGRAMNPCVDCKIFMLREAVKVAKKHGAKFIFTGEVLGQRPMSQRKFPLKVIEEKAGLKGKLLRPLSAKNLAPTEAEAKGWVDRSKLLNICGRSRKIQYELAKKYNLAGYSSPSGGCVLTEPEYSMKLKDLIKYKKFILENDLKLLKIKRHFRAGKSKIIVGTNEEENNKILKLKGFFDYIFVARDYAGPITILQGKKTKKSIKIAAELTARYSDSENEAVIEYGGFIKKIINVKKMSEEKIQELRMIVTPKK